jgi:hypothetical protein
MPTRFLSSFVLRSNLGAIELHYCLLGKGELTCTFRHPSSTLTAEAGVAVLQLKPEAFWEFSKVLFDRQIDFFDVNVVDEVRNETYNRLADIAAEVGVDKSDVLKLLTVPNKPQGDSYNVGNGVTNDIKKLVKVGTCTRNLRG